MQRHYLGITFSS